MKVVRIEAILCNGIWTVYGYYENGDRAEYYGFSEYVVSAFGELVVSAVGVNEIALVGGEK